MNSGQVTVEETIKILSRIGVRITPQRIIITKIILDNIKYHPSFREIHMLVQKELPRVGISTIFNTMKMLEEAGVIKIFEFNGETHIDRPEPHVNVYCINKNKIIDVNGELEEDIEKLSHTLFKKGLKIKNINVLVEAECPSDAGN